MFCIIDTKFITKSRITIRWYLYLSVTQISTLFKLKMMYLINRDERFEIGYDCSCPVFTLYSICKHTIRLDHDRNELNFHPDLDLRSLGCQAKK